MTSAFQEVPFSELLHHPAATADRLNRVRALRLRRRDASDLALMRVEQSEQEEVVVDFTSRLMASLVRTTDGAAFRQAVTDALPWTTFLPEQDVDNFLHELVAVAQGSAALENLSPLAILLTQWRNSAEVHANPGLLTILTKEFESDFGPVPRPEGNL
jgi:hypothetical protein